MGTKSNWAWGWFILENTEQRRELLRQRKGESSELKRDNASHGAPIGSPVLDHPSWRRATNQQAYCCSDHSTRFRPACAARRTRAQGAPRGLHPGRWIEHPAVTMPMPAQGLIIAVTPHCFISSISLKLNAIFISSPATPKVISSHKHLLTT